MFLLGLLLAIYGYSLFLLGVFGMVSVQNVRGVSLIFWLITLGIFLKQYPLSAVRKILLKRVKTPLTLLSKILLGLLVIQALVNFIGALGPELAFDALWYHLTFPKLYLIQHEITHIHGGLLYYSTMPKLTEMLYVGALAFQGEILTKCIHFSFGILTCLALYLVGRRVLSQTNALLATVIFYSNLVVGWESITAYVDLARTFYEVLALWTFLLFTEKQEKRYLILTGVMLGIAVSTKLLALGSIFVILILLTGYLLSKKTSRLEIIKTLSTLVFFSFFISLPWFIFSTLATGNPVYPFFSAHYDTSLSPLLLSPVRFMRESWDVLLYAADPLNPMYLMFLPLCFIFYKRFSREMKWIALYSGLSFLIWYITPRTGGGRFILPYLPAYSLLIAGTIVELGTIRMPKKQLVYVSAVALTVFISMVSIGYRGVANKRYIPVLLGSQTKQVFLTNNLNYLYGDFYDTDGFFAKTLKPTDTVLLYGFHNLYYVSFPFIHETWVKKGDRFTYIAVQEGKLPERFWYWPQIYYNPVTQVTVYSMRGQQWVY